MSDSVILPNNWQPRGYQLPAWTALERGVKRMALIWHRRAGKDDLALHWTACSAMTRVGNYWHMLPKANQARKALWDAVNSHTGMRRIDEAFPEAIRETTREQEMLIRFKNGSTWQVIGSDNYNQLVGAPPVGVVFSEYSLADPKSWDYLSPILVENGGWAMFVYTPRGRNWGWELYEKNRQNPDWFVSKLSVNDTQAFSKEAIDKERREGKSEELIQQEYYCSFTQPNEGAYYGKQMEQLWSEKRICRVAHEPGFDCETYWDLGIDDATAIWITQPVGRELRVLKYFEFSGYSILDSIAALKQWAEAHHATFSRHGMPHDVEVRELGTGKSRKETAMQAGLRPITVARKLSVEDGINAVRRVLPRCVFDEEGCKGGIRALTEYAKDYDDKHKTFKNKPRHDWASHGADAFRTLAVIYREEGGWFGQPAPSNVTVRSFNSQPVRMGNWEPFGA